MSDVDGDGIWTLTLDLFPDSLEYKFTLDGWNVAEEFTEGASCTITTINELGQSFTNRLLVLEEDTTLPDILLEQL